MTLRLTSRYLSPHPRAGDTAVRRTRRRSARRSHARGGTFITVWRQAWRQPGWLRLPNLRHDFSSIQTALCTPPRSCARAPQRPLCAVSRDKERVKGRRVLRASLAHHRLVDLPACYEGRRSSLLFAYSDDDLLTPAEQNPSHSGASSNSEDDQTEPRLDDIFRRSSNIMRA